MVRCRASHTHTHRNNKPTTPENLNAHSQAIWSSPRTVKFNREKNQLNKKYSENVFFSIQYFRVIKIKKVVFLSLFSGSFLCKKKNGKGDIMVN